MGFFNFFKFIYLCILICIHTLQISLQARLLWYFSDHNFMLIFFLIHKTIQMLLVPHNILCFGRTSLLLTEDSFETTATIVVPVTASTTVS